MIHMFNISGKKKVIVNVWTLEKNVTIMLQNLCPDSTSFTIQNIRDTSRRITNNVKSNMLVFFFQKLNAIM